MMRKSVDSRESPYKFNLREARRHVEEKDKLWDLSITRLWDLSKISL